MEIYRHWRFYLTALLVFFMTTAHATMQTETHQVQNAYYQWCSAFNQAKGDPAAIVQFYAPDAVLIPTLSSDFLINRDGGLNKYFTWLTNLPEIKCTPEKIVTHVHGDIAINSGFYKFSYQEKDKKFTVPARFTFVYKKIHDKWMIIAHHSSKMPNQD